LFAEIPQQPLASVKISDATLGEIYLANHARLMTARRPFEIGHRPSAIGHRSGFDLFVPSQSLSAVAEKLVGGAKQIGGGACGWQAFETARIEAGIPRFGADMDETTIPLECGLEAQAITYTKGCYIGQEVINRIHSVGHVNRELRGLRLADGLKHLPRQGDKLFHAGKEAGWVTSATTSPVLNTNIALGYVRREATQPGTQLTLHTSDGESSVTVVLPPFA
jgi:folate-binding protein YgfZ